MNNSTFTINELLKEIRLEFGYTQRELAKKVGCSQELLSKIEKGVREAADDILLILSTIYKADLVDYKSNMSKFKNSKDYIVFYELVAIAEQDFHLDNDVLAKKLNTKIVKNFDYGEPLLLRNYCKARIELFVKKNYDSCIDFCLQNFECSYDTLDEIVLDTLQSPFYYATLLLLSPALVAKGEISSAKKLLARFIDHLDTMWKNDFFSYSGQNYFYSKIYILLLANYSEVCLLLYEYELADQYADLTISKSGELNTLSAVHLVFKTKALALYNQNKLFEAKIILKHLELYCGYSEYEEFFENTIEEFKNSCPLLFT